MHEFKIPEDVPEALREIQRLLSTAMKDIDKHIEAQAWEPGFGMTTYTLPIELVRNTNSAMADSHLLCTWIRDQIKWNETL